MPDVVSSFEREPESYGDGLVHFGSPEQEALEIFDRHAISHFSMTEAELEKKGMRPFAVYFSNDLVEQIKAVYSAFHKERIERARPSREDSVI